MRTTQRHITTLLASAALLGLAACGGSTPTTTQPSVSAPQSTATSAAAQPSASAPQSTVTSAAAQPGVTSSAAPLATSAAETQAAATSVSQANRPYAALPQSRTPEGYYVLGNADAPVTLTFYSDFL
ncbi:MAG TPA: hypothetical protein VGD58_18555 [Herpetosiphonaceae bacterium]